MLAAEVAEWIGDNVTSCSFDTSGVTGNVFKSAITSFSCVGSVPLHARRTSLLSLIT